MICKSMEAEVLSVMEDLRFDVLRSIAGGRIAEDIKDKGDLFASEYGLNIQMEVDLAIMELMSFGRETHINFLQFDIHRRQLARDSLP